MRLILAATDLTERSRPAVERAAQLARDLGAQLVVAHVIDSELPPAVIEREQVVAEELIRDELVRLGTSRGEGDGEPRIVIAVGKDWADILRIADEEGADLLVVGPNRAKGIRDLFRGTTIERAIRRGQRPTLLVAGPVAGPYRKVMAGVDFSVSSKRALEFARKLSPRAGFSVAHAYMIPFKGIMMAGIPVSATREAIAEPFESMVHEELDRFLAGLDSPQWPIERIVREGDVDGVVRMEIARGGTELLALGTNGRTGIGKALLGSETEGFLADPPCDILTVKAW